MPAMPELLLIDRQWPCAAVVLSNDADPTLLHAEDELQTHLEKIGGARLPRRESTGDGAEVLLGRTPTTERLLGAFDWASLGEDGVVVRRVGEKLVVAGATPRGTLYAVYELLEREFGCRWLTPKVGVIPKRDRVAVDHVDVVLVPPFRYREPFFAVARDADFAARIRANGQHFPLDDRRGGQWRYAGFVHTFYELVPPAEFFASHPEYFSEIDGQRTDVGGQLCLTNPELIDVVTDRARRWLREQPKARILSISQNDWNGNCQCRNCRAMDEAEGSPSGAMVRFVNAVAERLEAEFPRVLFDTLAYTYTVAPPRHARPRRNVIIRLCHILPCCDAHPMEHCEQNREFVGYIKRWGEISPELFVWDYFNNFAHYFMPLPNLDAIVADIPMFARAGVTGMFCQGDGTPPKGSGEFAELKCYLIAKLLWNPNPNGRAIVQEFVRHYYGPAADEILRYLELAQAQVRDRPAHFNMYSPTSSPHLTQELREKGERLFEAAERKVAHDPELSDRVHTARLPLEYLKVRTGLRFAIRGTRYEPENHDEARRAERFFTDAREHGAGSMREGGRPIDAEIASVRGTDLVRVRGDRIELVVAPELGGRILSLVAERAGGEWLHQASPHEGDYPYAGGYEEYSGNQHRTPGWSEAYHAEASESAVILSATLQNGLHLSRAIGITGGSVTIVSTLTNPTDRVAKVTLRSHPEFRAGSWDELALLVRRRSQSDAWTEHRPWRDTDGGPRDGIWLRGDDLPASAWGLRRGDHELIVEFENAQDLDQCLLSWDKALGNVRLDAYAKPAELKPGGSVSLRQRWTPRLAPAGK